MKNVTADTKGQWGPAAEVDTLRQSWLTKWSPGSR
jgi:hypothetical protein